jgi:hypothetical protein
VSATTQHPIGTDSAAARVGVDPAQFSKWARRRGLKPVRYVNLGRLRYAVWDLDEVLDALERGPVKRKEIEGNGH